MNKHNITEIDVTRSLPPTLKQDPDMVAAAQVIGRQLQENVRLSRLNLIYHRIDELDEEKLDILAYDLHVDWYDYGFPIETKRQVIKDSVKVHKYLGTPYAVKTVLKSIFNDAHIREWFEYGGRPFTFRIDIDVTGTDMPISLQRRIVQQIYFYKNLRSHLDGLYQSYSSTGQVFIGAYGEGHNDITVAPLVQSEHTSDGSVVIASITTTLVEITVMPKLVRYYIQPGYINMGGYSQVESEITVSDMI